MTKIAYDHVALEAKKAKLIAIREELKTEFFGIDHVIDAIIESIKTWYLMPEIVTRPIIVNLFGLTGIGKTALVRSLVNKLGFSNKFVEVQMDGFSNGMYGSPTSICQIMEQSSINEGETGIILLDEFQRFSTVDDKGQDIKVERYQDVWMLLSDGKFSNDYSFIAKLEQELATSEYYADIENMRKAEEQAKKERNDKKPKTAEEMAKELAGSSDDEDDKKLDVKYKRKYKLYPYEAKMFKKLLKLPQPLNEIMTWETETVHKLMRDYIDQNKSGLIDYTKCLIFVAGNMDEAFQMANDVEDCDTSADVFYEYTMKIGVIEVKRALTRRFRPEQIARLGNNHIVYPSLRSSAYMSIIRRACRAYTEEAAKVCGISFEIDEKVYQEIYDNSVYPTQGTRPVFTSVHKMFGSPLSDAILWALENGFVKLKVELDVDASCLIFSNGDKRMLAKIQFDIRERRNERSDDFNALVAVHEAGHALVYAAVFKTAPREISVNVASFKGGYNLFRENMFYSKSDVLKRITACMGGIAAEEIVFGPESRSSGCESDNSHATQWASSYVRRLGMDGFASVIVGPADSSFNNNILDSNGPIELIMQDARKTAQDILTKHRDLLIDLSKTLLSVKKMNADDFVNWLRGRLEIVPYTKNKDVFTDYKNKLLEA